MPAHALGVPVLHRQEEPTPAFFDGEDSGAVGTPHNVGSLSDYLPLVKVGMAAAASIGRKKIVLPHEAEYPAASYFDPIPHSEPGPHLPVPLPLKRRGVQVRPDQFQKFGVR
jgi:hypothetical protein